MRLLLGKDKYVNFQSGLLDFWALHMTKFILPSMVYRDSFPTQPMVCVTAAPNGSMPPDLK